MELKNLSTFVAVAEKKSFVRASTHVGLSQPAVTGQIQRLERELGVMLFDRNRRSVQMTAAGEAFLRGAKLALAAAEEAALSAQRAASRQTERLRFGFPPSASRELIPNIMTKFHEQYPSVKLDLFTFHTSTVISELQKETIDLGLVRLPVQAKGLQIIRVHKEPLMVCLPKGHPLCELQQISISDLRNERFILYAKRWAPGFYARIIERCLEAGFSPDIGKEIDEMYIAPALVAAGEGVTILPRMVISSPIHNVVIKELTLHELSSDLGVAIRTTDRSPMHRSAISISKSVCKSFSVH